MIYTLRIMLMTVSIVYLGIEYDDRWFLILALYATLENYVRQAELKDRNRILVMLSKGYDE